MDIRNTQYAIRTVYERSPGLFLVPVGLVFGLLIARLPATWSLTVLLGAVTLMAALHEPLLGLALALLLGPLKALVGVAYPDLAMLDPGQFFFALAFGGWVLRGLARRELYLPFVPVAVPMLVYIGIGALSLWSTTDLPNGLKELIKWLQMLAVAVIVVDAARRRRVGWVLAAALLAGVAQAGIGVWQFGLRGHGPEHFEIAPGFYRAYGAFEQPNPFGGFMGMVWPLALGLALGIADRTSNSEIRNPSTPLRTGPQSATLLLASVGVAVAAGLGLLLSFSRGAWLGAAAATGVMLVFWPRRRSTGLALGFGALALVLTLLNLNLLPASIAGRLSAVGDFAQVYDVRGAHIEEENFSLVERIAHWQAATGMATAQPWLGVGLGNYDAAYPDFRLINWQVPLGHAHNIYLNVLAETGLLGLAAYLLLWVAIVGLTVRVAKRSAGWRRGVAVGLLGVWAHLAVHQLVDNLYVNNLHLYLGTMFGILSLLVMELPRTANAGRQRWVTTDYTERFAHG